MFDLIHIDIIFFLLKIIIIISEMNFESNIVLYRETNCLKKKKKERKREKQ